MGRADSAQGGHGCCVEANDSRGPSEGGPGPDLQEGSRQGGGPGPGLQGARLTRPRHGGPLHQEPILLVGGTVQRRFRSVLHGTPRSEYEASHDGTDVFPVRTCELIHQNLPDEGGPAQGRVIRSTTHNTRRRWNILNTRRRVTDLLVL